MGLDFYIGYVCDFVDWVVDFVVFWVGWKIEVVGLCVLVVYLMGGYVVLCVLVEWCVDFDVLVLLVLMFGILCVGLLIVVFYVVVCVMIVLGDLCWVVWKWGGKLGVLLVDCIELLIYDVGCYVDELWWCEVWF